MSLARKIVLGLTGGAAVLLIVSMLAIWYLGAWYLVFPSHQHDAIPPAIPADFGEHSEVRALIFSKTNSFRHQSAIPAARALFDEVAARRGWAVLHSENGAVFNSDDLERFDVVVFSNASGDMLSGSQEQAFQSWLERGGGWVGIHAAGDRSHAEWTWYQDTLIGGVFTQHIMGPQTQEARVVVEDRSHPVTRGLPAEFSHAEEWYSWDASARTKGFDVLLRVDESSYEPFARGFGAEMDLRMGDHPVVWARCVDRGRSLYVAMGHWAEAYSNPPVARLLENGLAWAAGVEGDECGGGAKGEPLGAGAPRRPGVGAELAGRIVRGS
jgi:type 1 glutamine amidotransferase